MEYNKTGVPAAKNRQISGDSKKPQVVNALPKSANVLSTVDNNSAVEKNLNKASPCVIPSVQIVVEDCSSFNRPSLIRQKSASETNLSKPFSKSKEGLSTLNFPGRFAEIRRSHQNLADLENEAQESVEEVEDKEEKRAFWLTPQRKEKARKKDKVQEVEEEGKNAIDTPGSPVAPVLPPEEYNLEENEERSMVEQRSLDNPKFKQLMVVLIDWVNDELASHRIIVKDIVEDLYDGQVLHKLFEKLSGKKLDAPEVTQSAEGQQRKLRVVLERVNQVLGLGRNATPRWSVESIHSKNIVAILHLLVALVRHYRAPVRLPENVSVEMVVVQKRDGVLNPRKVVEEITQMYSDYGQRGERDAFDTLFDHAPDKLKIVKRSLETFVNKQLSKINLEVTSLDEQFSDGVNLVLLMGLLEGYFVPLNEFHLTPGSNEQKIHNVAFAFELMNEAGLPKPKARPEDIVNLDLKSTLRVLYNLFTQYKHLN